MAFNLFGGGTIECRACHEQVSTDATECPHCGENLEGFKLFASTVKCRACHEQVSTDATECPHCGENLEGFKIFGSTVECRACHEQVSTDATECLHCGENFEGFKVYGSTVECRACHEQVSTDATECPHCGEDLEGFKLFGSTVECRACHHQVSTDAAECPNCGEDLSNSFFRSTPSNSSFRTNNSRQDDQRQWREPRESQSRPTYANDATDPGGWLIKWVVYIALFFGAVWLAFAVALPLVIINFAAICFIIGLTFNSDNKKYMFLLSLLGGIYIVTDYNKGWLTKMLVANVGFFEKVIPFFLYLNIAAGLIASYFLIRDFVNERNQPSSEEGEFSKRNLIIMGSLIAVGAATIALQKYFDSKRSTAFYSYANTQTQTVSNSNGINSGNSSKGSVDALVGNKIKDSIESAQRNAQIGTSVAAVVFDTTQMKSNLIGNIGNVGLKDQISNVSDIKAFTINKRTNEGGGVQFLVDLMLPNNSAAQMQMNYMKVNNNWSLLSIRENFVTVDVAIFTDHWVQFCPMQNCNWRLGDDSKISWKTSEYSQEYQSGSDVPPLSIPKSDCYLLKSREEGPLMVAFTFTPIN
ncbi:MAG: zinc ribbon domain-containing protein [Gammaproteobacteria bacterium]